MSLAYRKVDSLLSADAGGEVREGDCLLLELGATPREGELTLVRRGKAEAVCRWNRGCGGEVVGVVVGVKRRL
ncbi:MAG TPA: hypothetical protein VMX58_00495 [Patescibacteria group bacterium]|nr:hypothetical protein [Patescibacteria group bacterium]